MISMYGINLSIDLSAEEDQPEDKSAREGSKEPGRTENGGAGDAAASPADEGERAMEVSASEDRERPPPLP